MTRSRKPKRKRRDQEKIPEKIEVYESYLHVPHYIVYDRNTQNLRYFQWVEGVYQERSLNATDPLIWLADLEIGLGIWQGEFEGAEAYWLRWCDQDGHWLLTDTERAKQRFEQAEQRFEQERGAREQAEARLVQAARNLLATGMEPKQVAVTLRLSEAQIAAILLEEKR